MENYPGNSKSNMYVPQTPNPTPPARKVERVVTTSAELKKKPLHVRFRENFFSGVDARTVINDVIFTVLIPAGKDVISDAIISMKDQILFGESYSSVTRNRFMQGGPASTSVVNYNRISHGAQQATSSILNNVIQNAQPTKGRVTLEDAVLQTRAEAMMVLQALHNHIAKFEQVSVADYFEMVGLTGEYTDDKWGWTDVSRARVAQVRGGKYTIVLPQPEQLA